MKAANLILLFFLFAFSANSQNLIPNGGFEDSVLCLNNPGTMHPAQWFPPSLGSPDYFPQPFTTGCVVGSTFWSGGNYNNANGFQLPHSGRFFSGFYATQNGAFREYLEIELTDTLIANRTYYCEYYLNLAENSGYANDGIGIALSDSILYDYTTSSPLQLNFIAGCNTGETITDSLNWVLVSDTFVANGNEKYLIFGCIRSSSSINFSLINSTAQAGSYYYVDDISLIEISPCTPGNDTTICWNDSIRLGVPAIPNTVYSWQPNYGLSDYNSSNPKALPPVTTTYTLTQTQLGITSSAQVTIEIDTICDTLDFPEISVYPNPSNGQFFIQGTFPENTFFEVYDMLGQIVFEKYISPGDKTEQLSLLLADGIYTYRVVANGENLKTGKIVIE